MSNKANYSVKCDTGLPVEMPCDEVFFDPTWNARKAKHESADAEGTVSTSLEGYPGLVVDLATSKLNGAKFPQRDPCTVRPNPDFGKKKGLAGRRWLGVAGFQRYDAINNVAQGRAEEVQILTNPKQGGLTQADALKLKDANPTFRAYIKDLDECAARAENIAENMQRSTLTGPDIASGMGRLFKSYKDVGIELSDTRAATILGSNQSFISKLRRISEGTRDVVIPAGALRPGSAETTILEAWRVAPTKVTQNELDAIAKLDSPAKRVDAYLVAVKAKPAPVGAKVKVKAAHGPGSWLVNALTSKAPIIGLMLGTLQRIGTIQFAGRLSDEAIRALFLPLCVIPLDATTKGENGASHATNMARLADAINAAVREGMIDPVVKAAEAANKAAAAEAANKAAASNAADARANGVPAKRTKGKVAHRAET